MSTLRQSAYEAERTLHDSHGSQAVANAAHLEIVNAHNMYWKQWSENRENRTRSVSTTRKKETPMTAATKLGLRVLGMILVGLIVGILLNNLGTLH